MKKSILLCVLVGSGLFFSGASLVQATSNIFITSVPSSGLDTTFTDTTLSTSDISKLAVGDDVRIQTNGDWSQTTGYDESKYLEFTFNPTIPDGATIRAVTITNEFRRTGTLSGAKLEVWDGASFVDFPITTGVINTDHEDTIDVLWLLENIDAIRNTRVRFLAYRDSGGSTKTSHDTISMRINYLPAVTNVPPVVVDQNVTQAVDASGIINLTATDADGDLLAYQVTRLPSQGSLDTLTSGQVVYTPSGTIGADSFEYQVYDGSNPGVTGTVTITLTPGATAKFVVTPSRIVLPITDTSVLTVRSQDKFNNFTTNDSSTVVTAIPTQGGVLSITSLTLTNGLATVTASTLTSGIVSFNFYGGTNAVYGFTTLAFTPIPTQMGDSSTTTISVPFVSAVDTTDVDNPVTPLRSFADIPYMALSDTYGYASRSAWPKASSYNESRYIEFTSDTGLVPSGAVLDAVLLNHEFKKPSDVIIAAKLEVWNGTTFVSIPLTPPKPTDSQFLQVLNLTQYINAISMLDGYKVRLLLRGTTDYNTAQVYSNMMYLDVVYHIPTASTSSTTTEQTNTQSNSTPPTTNETTAVETPVVQQLPPPQHAPGAAVLIATQASVNVVTPVVVDFASSPIVESDVAFADTARDTSTPQAQPQAEVTATTEQIPLTAFAGGTGTLSRGSIYIIGGILIGLFLIRLYGFLYKEREIAEDASKKLD